MYSLGPEGGSIAFVHLNRGEDKTAVDRTRAKAEENWLCYGKMDGITNTQSSNGSL